MLIVCARFFYLGLFALVAFVLTAVAAFKYLEWWQATLVLLAVVVTFIFGAKYLIGYAVRTMGEKFSEMAAGNGKVLRNATVQVHSVKATDPPREMTEHDDEYEDVDEETLAEMRDEAILKDWYKIELTVFPNPDIEEHTQPWMPDALSFVPYDSEPPKNMFNADDLESIVNFEKMKVLTEETNEDGEWSGPLRLRILAGFPKDERDFAIRYFGEQFGRLRLPGPFADEPRRLKGE
jgi:hypothetical protein